MSRRADQRDRRRVDPARRRLGPSHGRSCPRFRLRSRWNGSGGLSGISKSTVSKLCKDIDDRVNAFLDRPLVGDWPYLWRDATYLKQREGGRTVSGAVIIAVSANTDGKREIVVLHIGPSEAETSGRHS